MCGRFAQTLSVESVAARFGATVAPGVSAAPRRRFNIAPTHDVLAVGINAAGPQLRILKWGLIPPWAKDRRLAGRMINARAETVAERPAFRASFKSQRCLIPAEGFYEWRRVGGARRPTFIRPRAGGLMAFAALWARWRDPEDHASVESCALLTVPANRQLAEIHERMPLILDPADWRAWMAGGVGTARALLGAARPPVMELRPVSRLVNDARSEDPACLRRAEDLDEAGGDLQPPLCLPPAP